jgi:hypothetical protein
MAKLALQKKIDLLQSADLDQRLDRVRVGGLGFLGHASYSADGSHAILWRSQATNGRNAAGTPCDGSYILLARRSGGFVELFRGHATWPRRACVSNDGICAVSVWESARARSFRLRVFDAAGVEIIPEEEFQAPHGDFAISEEGRYLAVLCDARSGAQDSKQLMIYDLVQERSVSAFAPLLGSRNYVHIDSSEKRVYLTRYAEPVEAAILYSFDGQFIEDKRYQVSDPSLPRKLPLHDPDFSQEECWHILSLLKSYRCGAGWRNSTPNDKRECAAKVGWLFEQLGETPTKEWVFEAEEKDCVLKIDPRLGDHLDALIEKGLHGVDRTEVALTLIRQQLVALAAQGILYTRGEDHDFESI